MEFNSEARRCRNCGAPTVRNAVHCGNCGRPLNAPPTQPPLQSQPPKQGKFSSGELTVIILVGTIVISLALFGVTATILNLSNPRQLMPVAAARTPTPTLKVSVVPPPPRPLGNNEIRLVVADEVRTYLSDDDIPAYVVADDTSLIIYYQAALIEYAPDTFIRQQGTSGMARIANAGFETLVIEAKDSDGHKQRKEFSLIKYRTQ